MKDAAFLQAVLDEIEDAGRTRTLRAVEPIDAVRVCVDGREVVNFCSNDYLGLAAEPRVVRAAVAATERFGAGSGSARLIAGTRELHLELERRLASFVGRESALLFGAGYLAGLGAIDALAAKGDAVFSDRLNHACLIDGCRICGARVVVYPHADAGALADLLVRTEARRKIVVTESVFSMDGDVAPLVEIAEVCERAGAMLIVDEAHAIGVMGPRGEGVVAASGLEGRVDAVMGTLGKALGSCGAFVAGSETLVRFLTNRARTFIFQTALPPSAIAAAAESLAILDESGERVERLRANVARLQSALTAGDAGESAIIPVVVGPERETMEASAALLDRGFLVQGIRPPTVPPGTSRLRLTVSSEHAPKQIDAVCRAIGEVAR